MDIFVAGKHKKVLTQNDFKAQGGEGSVYVQGGTAYKIYADPANVIPLHKIQELSRLTHPDIIRPQEIVLDRSRRPIGYIMTHVADAIPLCQTFTKAFRDRKGLTPGRALSLVQALQALVRHVHEQGLLIVDLNETNFLVGGSLEKLYGIDVDSYQTPGYPATAIMDSVRDRHAQAWTRETDWFSFAIVSFQMLVGIHPYKGKHTTLKSLEERMQANVSVLSCGVAVPATTLPFDSIPSSYRAWYKALFDQGLRCPPPERWDAPIVLTPIVNRVPQGTHFEIEELGAFEADIVAVARGVVVTTQGIVIGGRTWSASDVQVGGSPNNHRPLALTRTNGKAAVTDLTTGKTLASDLLADAAMACEGRMYVQFGAGLYFLDVIELPAVTLIQPRLIANLLPHATGLYEGVALQNMMGAWYASILGPNGSHHQKRVAELDGGDVVTAKYQNRVLMIVARRGGIYERLIFRFDSSHSSYDLRKIENVSSYGVNFTTLDNGICLFLNDQDALEVFSHKNGAQDIKVIADPAIDGTCTLFKNGSQALFARGERLYKFSMKAK